MKCFPDPSSPLSHRLTHEVSAQFCHPGHPHVRRTGVCRRSEDELPDQFRGTAAAQRHCSVFCNSTIAHKKTSSLDINMRTRQTPARGRTCSEVPHVLFQPTISLNWEVTVFLQVYTSSLPETRFFILNSKAHFSQMPVTLDTNSFHSGLFSIPISNKLAWS